MTNLEKGPPPGDGPILQARARALALEPNREDAQLDSIEVIEFRLAQEQYAFETTFVLEVRPLDGLTLLPGTPPFIAGIVNVRGRIVPVIDIKVFFELERPGISDTHMILIVGTPDFEVGFLADTVAGVRLVPVGAIQPTLPTLTGIRDEFLKGVTAQRLIILDVHRILIDQRIVVDEEVET